MIRIGTRGSKLALWQANYLSNELTSLGHSNELKIIKTKGDIIQNLSFEKLEGKGFFTKEIEDALLNNEVDIAVHSMKDLPTEQPEGLCITAISERADPRDILIIRKAKLDQSRPLKLPKGAIVGTSSIRRKTQLLDLVEEIEIKDLRGNVPTRIKKLLDGNYDAIVLAMAGIERLKIKNDDLEMIPLNPKEFVPAPAQGVLAFQSRIDNISIRKIFKAIHQSESSDCTNVERKVLSLFNGGCQLALGVYCHKDKAGYYHASAAYCKDIDSKIRRVSYSLSTNAGMAEKIFEALKQED